MRRRDFLTGLLATTTASARAAEPNRIYRLAVTDELDPGTIFFLSSFYGRLRQLGYTEGKNLIVDRYTSVFARPERYEEIARKMVEAKPDVIALGLNHRFTSEVAKATSTIPIATLIGSVDVGLVRNINRPEGNITGIIFDAGIEMQGKHLDFLRQAVPAASRIAYLSSRYDWEGAWGRAVLQAGRQSGISIIGVPVEESAGEQEYRQAFDRIVEQSADALMYNGLFPNYVYRELIAELALKYRLPSICWFPDLVEQGQAPMAYAAYFPDAPERCADLVDQLFKGVKVADIPLAQPTKFILAINLKTAKTLGLEISPTLIAQADEVIE
jgi:putative ABC transport system substrate-binding protein